MNLAPTTRMAFQAAVAVGLVIAVNSFFGLTRPVWGVLMAVVVIAGAWGDNLGKLKDLLVGTVLAVAASWLFIFLGGNRTLPVTVAALICIFFWAYYGPVSYARACAWMGAFAIVIVSYLKGSRYDIALARGIQVAVGGGLGLLVSACVLPVRSDRDLAAKVAELLKLLRETAARGFADLVEGSVPPGDYRHCEHGISRKAAELIKLGRTAGNETIVFPSRRRRLADRLDRLRRLASYTNDLLEGLTSCRDRVDTPGLRNLFIETARLVDEGLSACAGESGEVGPAPIDLSLARLREHFQSELNTDRPGLSRRDLAPFLLVFFSVRGLLETAAELALDRPGEKGH